MTKQEMIGFLNANWTADAWNWVDISKFDLGSLEHLITFLECEEEENYLVLANGDIHTNLPI